MLARLNIVEGIFSERLGLLILATDVRLTAAGADPFTATKGATLLDQLASYRSALPAVRARGLAHLVTGKDLDGTTAGIAYVGTVCSAERGVSLSMSSYGTTISALIMAHELGHNLGASHDGEAGTTCASVGGGFIMAPAVSGFATFSSCSLNVIQQTIANAGCITPAEFADVAIDVGTTKVSGEGGVPFSLPFVVKSGGNLDAENVVATVTLPALSGYALDSAASSAGACTVSGLTATCDLGTMPIASQHTITLNAHGTTAQNFTVQASVASSNDKVTSNNTRGLPVSIRSGIDAAVTLSASTTDTDVGAQVEIYADVSSLRAMALTNATLSVNVNQPVISASMPGATCNASTFAVTCSIATVPPGTSSRLTIATTASAAGALFAGATINLTGDGDYTNNATSLSGWVRAAHDVDLAVGPPVVDLGVAQLYDVPFVLRSRGTGDAVNTRLTITLQSPLLVVEAVDDACDATTATTWVCDVGTIATGDSRQVRFRVHGTAAGTAGIGAVATADDDGYSSNDGASLQLRIDNPIDLAVTLASGGVGVEEQPISGQVTVRSLGRQTVSGGTLDLELQGAGVFEIVAIHNGDACAILTAQHARCTLPSLARNAQVYVDWQGRFDDPGSYNLVFTAAAAGDSAPDNDVLQRPVIVRPWNDIAVTGSFDFTDLMVGQSHTRAFVVSADRRALAAARFVAPNALPGLRVTDISSTGGDCRVDADTGGICDFTNLAPDSQYTVTVTWKAEESAAATDLLVGVSTTGDVSSDNDAVRTRIETYGLTDLELRVGAATSGYRNATVALPEITVVNGNDKAFGARLAVTLPTGVTLASVSAANAICTGTAVLTCDFSELAAGSVTTVNVNVLASATGTFTAPLKLTANNDANDSNDSKDASLQITEPVNSAQTAGGGSKSSGGGGRFEWLALAFLALVVVRRCVVVVRANAA